MSYVAILISRQEIHPTSDSDWVRQACRAAEFIAKQNYSICSSVGMKTWGLITALASIYKIPIKIIFPLSDKTIADKTRVDLLKEEIISQFNLDRNLSVIEPLFYSPKNRADRMGLRDKAVINSSDILMPISLRRQGSLNKLLKFNQKQIIENFITKFESAKKKQAYEINDHNINPEIKLIAQKYLIHWTKSSNRKWPTEKEIDYYSSILSNRHYPRGAFETLKNILDTKTIVASSNNMPLKTKTVSFSAHLPGEATKLMRWRRKYCQMSLEPYGIGIKTELAERLSVLPVNYIQKSQINKISHNTKWLTQSVGKITDWRKENEQRHEGDFLLGGINKEDLIIFTRSKKESDEISRKFQIRSINMLKQ